METENELFASKQCDEIEEEEKVRNPAGSFQEKFEFFTAQRNDVSARDDVEVEEEPIDLTKYGDEWTNRAEPSNLQRFPGSTMQPTSIRNSDVYCRRPGKEAQPFQIVNCPGTAFGMRGDYFPKRKRKRRKFVYTHDGKLLLYTEDSNQTARTFPPAKQQEILNAAKALFSKRTRTLYHWMYPNAAKQQLKTVIANSWDSLEDREKEFYISQVLGRFGYPQTNLMVNPQLGTIRHLPPPPPLEGEQHFLVDCTGRLIPTGDLARAERACARKRGRPKGGYASARAAADFQDDPELSLELEKFATTFDLSRVV